MRIAGVRFTRGDARYPECPRGILRFVWICADDVQHSFSLARRRFRAIVKASLALLGEWVVRRAILLLLTLMLTVIAYAAPAFAEKRVALVIGISDYTTLSRLNNPVPDARP